MIESILHIAPLNDHQEIPFDLLRLADPSMEQINHYLKSGICYVAKLDKETIGVMVLNEVSPTSIEIKNIAIKESFQGRGFGKILLKYADKTSREDGYEFLKIGTGNSSIGQLSLYQKEGFEIKGIDQDFFIKNYSKPIFENGIQCKHMIILVKDLKE